MPMAEVIMNKISYCQKSLEYSRVVTFQIIYWEGAYIFKCSPTFFFLKLGCGEAVQNMFSLPLFRYSQCLKCSSN